jgi:hypothetical protein
MNTITKVKSISIKIKVLFLLLMVSNAAHSSFPVEWALEKQISRADKIALVEVVSVRKVIGHKLVKKEVLVKVISDVFMTNVDEELVIISSNAFGDSKLSLNKSGQRAVVIINEAPQEYYGSSRYLSVNFNFSVYTVKNNCVYGLMDEPIKFEDALSFLKSKNIRER